MADPKGDMTDLPAPGKDVDSKGAFGDPTHTDHVRDEFMRTRSRMDIEHKLPITGSRNAKW